MTSEKLRPARCERWACDPPPHGGTRPAFRVRVAEGDIEASIDGSSKDALLLHDRTECDGNPGTEVTTESLRRAYTGQERRLSSTALGFALDIEGRVDGEGDRVWTVDDFVADRRKTTEDTCERRKLGCEERVDRPVGGADTDAVEEDQEQAPGRYSPGLRSTVT